MSKLHIFPVYGRWEPTPQVMVLVTNDFLPLSQAYIDQVEEAGQDAAFMRRDWVFEALASPAYHSVWDDVVVYAEPYTERYCTRCEDTTYWHEDTGQAYCDRCGLVYESMWQ